MIRRLKGVNRRSNRKGGGEWSGNQETCQINTPLPQSILLKKKRHGEINLDQIEKREEEALIIKDQVPWTLQQENSPRGVLLLFPIIKGNKRTLEKKGIQGGNRGNAPRSHSLTSLSSLALSNSLQVGGGILWNGCIWSLEEGQGQPGEVSLRRGQEIQPGKWAKARERAWEPPVSFFYTRTRPSRWHVFAAPRGVEGAQDMSRLPRFPRDRRHGLCRWHPLAPKVYDQRSIEQVKMCPFLRAVSSRWSRGW